MRYLHMLGAIFAVLAVIVLGLLGISPAGRELMPAAGYFAAIAVLVGYIVYAQRRSTALLNEEAERSREEAAGVFEQIGAAALATGVTLRWRARTYVLSVVLLVIAGAVAAGAWIERSWPVLALCGLLFAWAAKSLVARLGEPDVLRVGPTGIEDKIKFGLIPWQDIERVFVHEYEIKGTKAASLSISVRDPAAYLGRLGPIARFSLRAETLGMSNDLRFPLQTLDMAPLALFRVIRAFHERALPAGAISGTDHFYLVDLEFAKLKQVMAELEKTVAGPASASGGPTRRQEELAARMDALIKANTERISRPPVQPEKTNWPVILAVSLALLIALLVGAGVFSR